LRPGKLAGIELGPRWLTVWPTRICITCSSEGAGVETGLRGLWFFITNRAPANVLKSTSRSARSAGASTNSFIGTG
jgi:hypothetical protein